MKSKKIIGVIAVLAVISLVFAGSAAAASVASSSDSSWIVPTSDASYGTGIMESSLTTTADNEAVGGVIIVTGTGDEAVNTAADTVSQIRVRGTGTTADVSGTMMVSDADSMVNSSSNSSAVKSMRSSENTGSAALIWPTTSDGTNSAKLNSIGTTNGATLSSDANSIYVLAKLNSIGTNSATLNNLGTTVATLNNTYMVFPISLNGLNSYAKATGNVADLNRYLVNLNNLSTNANSSLQADLTTMMDNLNNTSNVNTDIKTVNDVDVSSASGYMNHGDKLSIQMTGLAEGIPAVVTLNSSELMEWAT